MGNIYNNLNKIFEIQDVDYNRIVIKVKADSPLMVAEYPFITMQMKYVTVTRGIEHILTVIKDDGSSYSFHWGHSGYTIISEISELLKLNICRFIEDNGILIGYDGDVIEDIHILYNKNFKKWQLNVNGAIYRSKTAKSMHDMVNECEKFIGKTSWISKKANTGIEFYEAINIITKIK